MVDRDPFGAKATLEAGGQSFTVYRLDALREAGVGHVDKLPYSIKVLLEACLRELDGYIVEESHVRALASWDAKDVGEQEIPFKPGRVVLQDFTGVPAVVDFAALRSAMERMGGDVTKVNPLIRADLVIDHSVQVDAYGTSRAMGINTRLEFERNNERYEFLKWGQGAFDNFSVVPPETGIVHQVNLEYLASGVLQREVDGELQAYPDSLVGTDSHTTMINGLGVVGWGAGGIEAEACMLGQPIYMLIPEVVGFELTGKLPEGATATDLVLLVTQMLRKHGVVEKFVEFYGSGLDALTLADRATIANMAPEYGATIGFFPIDQKSLDYMALTGRSAEQLDLVEKYAKLQGLWRDDSREITYTANLHLDLGTVQPSLAGPKRPQDRVLLSDMKGTWHLALRETFGKKEASKPQPVTYEGERFELKDGDVVIAAITSCTNTSNPAVMLGAGLVARKAAALGLKAKPWVKTSLAPGSRVVSDYLDRAELTAPLQEIGFFTVGYGCTTCIGNSGPLPDPIRDAIVEGGLAATSVLSGNRNFEGRVSPHTMGNFLASPPLVVAYALAGTVDIDLHKDPIAKDKDGNDVYLRDVWPSNDEIAEAMARCVTREQFKNRYANVFEGGPEWQAIDAPSGQVYDWKDSSTYIQEPPYFVDMPVVPPPIAPIEGARCLVKVAHSVTTDHISPAGVIPPDSPAACYLESQGVSRGDFNSFGSRRGNDRVMTRGTFANIRVRNQLAPGTEGGYTTYLGPDAEAAGPFPWLTYATDRLPKRGETCFIYDAAVKYQQHRIPLVVLAGKDYGMGSSRDWAAKGTYLLGVRAVIAESYERIHRSNLIGMGVLPLQYLEGQTAESLGLTGRETFSIAIGDDVKPLSELSVTAVAEDGGTTRFSALCRIDTPVEVDYFRNGGILHTVLRRLAS
ncbi:MAG: aconitate hydratase AcnA [Deltaproteobacteria bacterium]|nr:aconitate hydratase AcnA [Deltaproteobacteria bacterium]